MNSHVRLNHDTITSELTPERSSVIHMALNKKNQKQIDSLKKKLPNLQQQLSGAKKQPDDPAEIPRLEKEIATIQQQIRDLQNG